MMYLESGFPVAYRDSPTSTDWHPAIVLGWPLEFLVLGVTRSGDGRKLSIPLDEGKLKVGDHSTVHVLDCCYEGPGWEQVGPPF